MYIHTTPSGKKYVGITSKKPKERWQYGNGYSQNISFWRAIKKYGWKNIRHEIVKSGVSAREAQNTEMELIKRYNSMDPRCGYNHTFGGERNCGHKHSEETKAKMRNIKIGKKPKFTSEWRNNISTALIGHDVTIYSRVKLHNANVNGGNKRAKRVYQYTPEMKLIGTYYSMREAEEKTGVRHEHISACHRGLQRKAGGFIWKVAS